MHAVRRHHGVRLGPGGFRQQEVFAVPGERLGPAQVLKPRRGLDARDSQPSRLREPFEVGLKFEGGLVAPGRVLLQRLEDDPLQRRPDITLAREKMGWEPTIPLSEGLQRTIDWFRSVDLSKFRAPTPNY